MITERAALWCPEWLEPRFSTRSDWPATKHSESAGRSEHFVFRARTAGDHPNGVRVSRLSEFQSVHPRPGGPWTRGKHTVRAGTQIGRYAANNVVQSNSLFGSLSFSNRYTGFPYADFLVGYPSTSSVAAPALNAPFQRWAYDFFVTDEFKITPKLTANIGLRYEFHPAWNSTNGLASTFDPATGKIMIQDGSQNLISPYFPTSYVGIETASQGGYREGSLIKTDTNNWAPRIGLAWRPFDDKTVFRAGFGVFYDLVPTQPNEGERRFQSVRPVTPIRPEQALAIPSSCCHRYTPRRR